MFHPDVLPRASTLALTKEYTFLRTSVPRGPKVGSLGIPNISKDEKTSKSSRSSKIRSLADYKTHSSDTESGIGRSSSAETLGSLKVHRTGSSTSVISEIGFASESDRLEISLHTEDSSSELDGFELGSRLDENESDSSSYSSVSTVALYGTMPSLDARQKTTYTVDGQEISSEDLGHFPSIREVLAAAAAATAEHRSEMQQVNGAVRSRRDSLSSRYIEPKQQHARAGHWRFTSPSLLHY